MNIFQDDRGNWSLMRILGFGSFLLGAFGFVWGVLHGNTQAILTGGGLVAASNWAKAVQKRFENEKT